MTDTQETVPAGEDEVEALRRKEASRQWCIATGVDPDFHWDGQKNWQLVGLIDQHDQAVIEDLRKDVAELEAALSSEQPARAASGAVEVRGLTQEDQPTAWPPLKKALWLVVTGERLNDGRYVNAYELTNKLHAAALTAAPAPALVSEPSCDDQLAEAKRLASNLGYMVVPDPIHADGDVHAPDFVLATQPSLRALGFHAVPLSNPASQAQLAAATERAEKAEARAGILEAVTDTPLWSHRALTSLLHECISTRFGVRFMDPPDGGDVRIHEQVDRMAEALSTAEATIATLTADLGKMRRAMEGAVRIVAELDRQNIVNDSYARGLPKAERHTSELWLVCNSHVKDRTREISEALSPSPRLADDTKEIGT